MEKNELLNKIIKFVESSTNDSDEYAPGYVDAEYLIEYLESLR